MDELYTITFQDYPEKSEKIPERKNPAVEKISHAKQYDKKINQSDKISADNPQELYTITMPGQSEKSIRILEKKPDWNDRIAERLNNAQNKKSAEISTNQVIERYNSQGRGAFSKKVRTQNQFYSKYGKPPSPLTKDILARKGNFQLPVHDRMSKRSFFETAREYADKTHEKTEHIPFLCFWPNYEYMSEPQLNWYFYLRSCLRNGEYIDTDLSYIFVYIYELINQIGVNHSDDGFERMIKIWKSYRKTHEKLDRYLVDWTSDYIRFYNYDAEKAFELLKKDDLYLLMPTDMLTEHYIKNNIMMPLELIARFSDYRFYESEFIKSADGNLFTDHLPVLFDKIRRNINQEEFEARYSPAPYLQWQNKVPFLRAPFDNKNNIRLYSYLPYEQHKPLRGFITAIAKEFENQLRTLRKHRGRLRPDKLPDEVVNLCKIYAKNAVTGVQSEQNFEAFEQKVEIKIDRGRLLALIQDSDEVRKKLIEGNYEYGEPETSEQIEQSEQIDIVSEPVQDSSAMIAEPELQDSGNKLLPNLSPVQQQIIDFLLAHRGSSSSSEIGAAFPGVFVGVEIDRINDAALETMGDLLIAYENERWCIIEDYIDDL